MPDVVLQCVNKVFARFHSVDISYPSKTCASLTPLSIAGVSKKIVSVATDSCLQGTLRAGFLLFRCFFILLQKESRAIPHHVVWSIVSLSISEVNPAKI